MAAASSTKAFLPIETGGASSSRVARSFVPKANLLSALSVLQGKGQGTILPHLRTREATSFAQVCTSTFAYSYIFLKARRSIDAKQNIYKNLDREKIIDILPKESSDPAIHSYTLEMPSVGKVQIIVTTQTNGRRRIYAFTSQTPRRSDLGTKKIVGFPFLLTEGVVVAFLIMNPDEARKELEKLEVLKNKPSILQPIEHFPFKSEKETKHIMVFPFSPGDMLEFTNESIVNERQRTRSHNIVMKKLSTDIIVQDQFRLYLRAATSALKGIHEEGIVHSDVKWENFLVMADCDQTTLYIIDYGNSIRSGDFFQGGTFSNIPPAIITDKAKGPIYCQHDIYGLGICWYSFLTQRLPDYGFPSPDKKAIFPHLRRAFLVQGYADSFFRQLRPADPFYGLVRLMVNPDDALRPSIRAVIDYLNIIEKGNPVTKDLKRQMVASSLSVTLSHKLDSITRIGSLASFWSNKDLVAQALCAKTFYISSWASLRERRIEQVMRIVYDKTIHNFRLPLLAEQAKRFSTPETGLAFSVIVTEKERISCFYTLYRDSSIYHQIGYDPSRKKMVLVTSTPLSLTQKRMSMALQEGPHILIPYRFIEGLSHETVSLSPFMRESLENWLKKTHTLKDRLTVIYQMSQAISFMHEHGICFVDCRPKNCFLVPDSPLSIKLFLHPAMRYRGERMHLSGLDLPPRISFDEIGMQAQFSFDLWQLGMMASNILADGERSPEIVQLLNGMLMDDAKKRITMREVASRLKIMISKMR